MIPLRRAMLTSIAATASALKQAGRRFPRAKRGSVAIEFALLALPFSLLVFAILETSVSYVAQQTMSNITDDIARQLRTGQLQASDVTGGKLRQMICNRLQIMVAQGCPDLFVDLENYSSFDQVPTTIPLTPSGDLDTSGFKVDPGGSQSINQLRVFYKWPIMTDVMREKMSSLPGGKTLLFSTDTWQNEPY